MTYKTIISSKDCIIEVDNLFIACSYRMQLSNDPWEHLMEGVRLYNLESKLKRTLIEEIVT